MNLKPIEEVQVLLESFIAYNKVIHTKQFLSKKSWKIYWKKRNHETYIEKKTKQGYQYPVLFLMFNVIHISVVNLLKTNSPIFKLINFSYVFNISSCYYVNSITPFCVQLIERF